MNADKATLLYLGARTMYIEYRRESAKLLKKFPALKDDPACKPHLDQAALTRISRKLKGYHRKQRAAKKQRGTPPPKP